MSSHDQAEEDYGAPLAPHSEWQPGQLVRYETGRQVCQGLILHIMDGQGGGQFYLIENREQGFPDVVPARELIGE